MAIALTQETQFWDGSTSTTTAKAYASNVTAGGFLWCYVAWKSSTATCTVSDSRNGAWTAVGSAQTGSGSLAGWRCQMFYFPNAAAGATTVTATISASVTTRGLAISEFSGVATSSPLDQSAYGNSNSNGVTTPTVTTLNADDLLVAGVLASTTVTGVAGSYTYMATDLEFSGNGTEYKVVSATGTYGPNFTEGTTNDNLVGIAAFKAAATGQTLTPPVGDSTAASVAPGVTIITTAPVSAATGDAVAPTLAWPLVIPAGVATADAVAAALGLTILSPYGDATADAVIPAVGDATILIIPEGVATADAIAAALGITFDVPVGAATADAATPTHTITITSVPGISTAEAVAAIAAVALVSPAGTATADAAAPTFLQRLIATIQVVITQPAALSSTIHQRIIAPVITAARAAGTAIFRN